MLTSAAAATPGSPKARPSSRAAPRCTTPCATVAKPMGTRAPSVAAVLKSEWPSDSATTPPARSRLVPIPAKRPGPTQSATKPGFTASTATATAPAPISVRRSRATTISRTRASRPSPRSCASPTSPASGSCQLICISTSPRRAVIA